ncbi:putative quinol monooxygenase [Sphingomonas flavalba]|uniref:putative quinol monooxygenase n=1 Tax=Sphingomonas flavalba TaxID=2559804 RepID=UPI00109D9CDE|nr:antibiotic biosynthesis monooxygenase family protein [Sphingomonas flavalba]
MSVLEHALITIRPGAEAAFEAAFAQAVPLFRTVPGCQAVRLDRSVEHRTYVLLARWDEVADHMAFRASPAFARWRELVASHFAAPPQVEHLVPAVAGFGTLED